MKIIKSHWFISALLLLTLVGVAKVADVGNATKVNTFMTEGPHIFSDTQQTANITLPTVTTASDFATWVPVYNAGAAVSAGTVLIASNVANGVVYVNTAQAITGMNTVVGVAAEAIAATSKGYMIPIGGGYAPVLATGTITIGQILVTTTSAAGYATGISVSTGSHGFGTALSSNTAATGGTVIAVLHK